MLDVKEAVTAARHSAKEFFEGSPLDDLQLEEVEYDESSQAWLITLGFNVKSLNPLSGLGAAFGGTQQYTRKYKVFCIDATTGSVRSMKIREV